jgi:hypothetical protein
VFFIKHECCVFFLHSFRFITPHATNKDYKAFVKVPPLLSAHYLHLMLRFSAVFFSALFSAQVHHANIVLVGGYY